MGPLIGGLSHTVAKAVGNGCLDDVTVVSLVLRSKGRGRRGSGEEEELLHFTYVYTVYINIHTYVRMYLHTHTLLHTVYTHVQTNVVNT